jgi:hypothetical protein
MGLNTKTCWLTDRQSQCDFKFDLAYRESKESSGVQSSAWSQEDRSDDSSARKESTEYRTQKIVFGLCVVKL